MNVREEHDDRKDTARTLENLKLTNTDKWKPNLIVRFETDDNEKEHENKQFSRLIMIDVMKESNMLRPTRQRLVICCLKGALRPCNKCNEAQSS